MNLVSQWLADPCNRALAFQALASLALLGFAVWGLFVLVRAEEREN